MFAVLDVETTGFDHAGRDRVVELAVIGLDRDGNEEFRWASLFNPVRDVGPTHIHGISEELLAQTQPATFAEMAGDIAELLGDRIPVAHNLAFDRGFLTAEFARCEIQIAGTDGLCTMGLASVTGSRRLESCCDAYGIVLSDAHTALGDTEATAQLFASMLREPDRHPGLLPLPSPMRFSGPVPEPLGRSWTRQPTVH